MFLLKSIRGAFCISFFLMTKKSILKFVFAVFFDVKRKVSMPPGQICRHRKCVNKKLFVFRFGVSFAHARIEHSFWGLPCRRMVVRKKFPSARNDCNDHDVTISHGTPSFMNIFYFARHQIVAANFDLLLLPEL